MRDALTIARRLAAKELVVIPILPPSHDSDGKTPKFAWKRYQTERPDDTDLIRWFTPGPMNLAIVTGYLSGVVVIDVDGGDGLAWAEETLPVTPWRTKTSRGTHYYFRHPSRHVPSVRLDGDLPVDVKGDGGLITGPGSRHRSGVWYRAIGDWTQPKASLPLFDVKWLPTPRTPEERVTNKEPPRGNAVRIQDSSSLEVCRKRAAAYLSRIPPPVIGCGSDREVFIAACRCVKGFALSPEDAEELLWAWAGERPGWTRSWIQQKVKSAINGKEAIGALL